MRPFILRFLFSYSILISYICRAGNLFTTEQIPESSRIAEDFTLDDTLFQKGSNLGKKLGKGSFGNVYIIEFQRGSTKQYLAVKICETRKSFKRALFARQARFLSEINHESIVKHYDCKLTWSSAYGCILMEIIRGCNFFEYHMEFCRKFGDRVGINQNKAKKLLLQVARAIDYLQEKNIIHRDIKPENIMLDNIDDPKIAKLIDFDFAKRLRRRDPRTSTKCGSPAYIAPEIYSCEKYPKFVDLWSFGAMAFALLTAYNIYDTPSENFPSLFFVNKTPRFDLLPSEETKVFIQSLLKFCPEERNGANAPLQNDPWFESDELSN